MTSEGASSAAELKIPGLGGDPGPRALPLPLPLPLLAQTMLSAVSSLLQLLQNPSPQGGYIARTKLHTCICMDKPEVLEGARGVEGEGKKR